MAAAVRYEITRLLDDTFKLKRLGPTESILGPFSHAELKEFLADSVDESRLAHALKDLEKPNQSVSVEGEGRGDQRARSRNRAKAATSRKGAKGPSRKAKRKSASRSSR